MVVGDWIVREYRNMLEVVAIFEEVRNEPARLPLQKIFLKL